MGSNQWADERRGREHGSTLGETDTLSEAELVVRWANAASVQVPLKDVRSHRQIARGGFEAGARRGSRGNCICCLLQDPDKSRFVLRTQ